jgi:CO/xanthine dehydrogenase FAD-binding subunit
MLRNVTSYERPTSIEDAVALAQSTPNAAYVGGGAWITAQADPELETLIDLQDVDGLDILETEFERVRLGAMVSVQALIDHPDVSQMADGVLATAADLTQSRTLREQGSLGGTLIVGGPADPLTTVMLVLDAEICYADPAVHTAPFMSFVAYRDRLIETRVLLTEVRIRRPPARSATAFEFVGRSPKDRPIVCVAAHLTVEEGLPASLRVAVGGVASEPVRLHKTEHLIPGKLLNRERIEAALAPSLGELEPIGDYKGSAEYRMAMAQVLSRRAILGAWERARRR